MRGILFFVLCIVLSVGALSVFAHVGLTDSVANIFRKIGVSPSLAFQIMVVFLFIAMFVTLSVAIYVDMAREGEPTKQISLSQKVSTFLGALFTNIRTWGHRIWYETYEDRLNH